MTPIGERAETFPLDNTKPDLAEHLFDTLNEMRQQHPVAWSGACGGFWALSTYEDTLAAAADWKHFTSAEGIMIPPTGATIRVIPAELDPPRHSKFRKLVLPYFTDAALQKWVPGVRAIIDEAFAPLLPKGRADFVTEIAHPVPVLAISLVLGLGAEDWRIIRNLAGAFVKATGDAEMSRARALELERYLQSQIEIRQGRPAADILGALVNADVGDDDPVKPEEVLGLVQLMVVAGHETTVNAMATMTYRLMTSPDLFQRLHSERELIDGVINETLRLHPPVWNMARTVASDVEVRGSRMCPGEKVMLVFGSANRDPDRFEDPEIFNPERSRNQHLAFGTGRHRCLGESLARLELRLTLEYLLDKLSTIELDGDPVWSGGTNQHGLKTLPIKFSLR